MERNVRKYINDYNKRFVLDGEKKNKNSTTFFRSDYIQIKEMSHDTFSLIDNAVMFGFMVGYNAGKKEKGC